MATSSSPGRLSYPSDVTDKQWALIEPLLPPPSTDGRPEKHPRREIVNAILYVLRTGCAWRLRCDYERRTDTAEAMTKWAMIGLVTRQLAPGAG